VANESEHIRNPRTDGASVLEMPLRHSESRHRPAIRTDAVSVVYTSFDDTLEAAKTAADLAQAMGAPLRLIHFRTVLPQVPVNDPGGLSPLESDGFLERLRGEGITAVARVYLCRDEARTIPYAFKPHSIVVIGGHRSWWPTRAERLRDALEAAGHFVVFVDPSEHKEPSHA
jgi:hypothetical protein